MKWKFTPLVPLDSQYLLNFKLLIQDQPCPHCLKKCYVKSHGYVYGYCSKGLQIQVRRFRFYCSPRGHNWGCARTFSVLWSEKLAHTFVSTSDVLTLLISYTQYQNVNLAWNELTPPFSISSAYRWVKRWKNSQGWIRSRISTTHPPPRETAGLTPTQVSLQHLQQFAVTASCIISHFQNTQQQNFFSY